MAPATLYVAVEVLEILCRYGPAGLATLVLRREFVEAAELLRKVAGVDEGWPRSAHELTAAIYYLLALNRGERGNDPDSVLREFRDEPSVVSHGGRPRQRQELLARAGLEPERQEQ